MSIALVKSSPSNRRGPDLKVAFLTQPRAASPTPASWGLPSPLAGEGPGVRGRVGGGVGSPLPQVLPQENLTHSFRSCPHQTSTGSVGEEKSCVSESDGAKSLTTPVRYATNPPLFGVVTAGPPVGELAAESASICNDGDSHPLGPNVLAGSAASLSVGICRAIRPTQASERMTGWESPASTSTARCAIATVVGPALHAC